MAKNFLVVGLGNPEGQYFNTYHNAGFIVIESIVKNLGGTFKKKGNLEYFKNGNVIYLKPLTYMNLSGQAVKWALRMFKVLPEDMVVVYDDLYIEKQKLRIRLGGSSGGQKGVQNIIDLTGNKNFIKVRVGIAPEKPLANRANYVLSKIKPEDNLAIDKAAEAIGFMLENLKTKKTLEVLAAAQQQYN